MYIYDRRRVLEVPCHGHALPRVARCSLRYASAIALAQCWCTLLLAAVVCDAGDEVTDLEVEESAALGTGWGCCNCADCFPGTGGCRHKDPGCCQSTGPFCCNVGLFPARHRDFCRQAWDTSKAAATQLRCEVCEHVAQRVVSEVVLVPEAAQAVSASEQAALDRLAAVCEGREGTTADPERWKHLDLKAASKAAARDAASHPGAGSLDALLAEEGWEVVEPMPGKYSLQKSSSFGSSGCIADGKTVRQCTSCPDSGSCEQQGCQWRPGGGAAGGWCAPWLTTATVANFSSRDAIKLACRATLGEYQTELAELLYLRTRNGEPIDQALVREHLCVEWSGACKRRAKVRRRGGAKREL